MLCAPAPPALRATATCTRSHSRARACREPAPSAQRCATARPPPAPPLPCCGRCAPLGARRRLSLARQTATTATARRTAGWRLLARVEPSSGGHRTASTSPTLVGLLAEQRRHSQPAGAPDGPFGALRRRVRPLAALPGSAPRTGKHVARGETVLWPSAGGGSAGRDAAAGSVGRSCGCAVREAGGAVPLACLQCAPQIENRTSISISIPLAAWSTFQGFDLDPYHADVGALRPGCQQGIDARPAGTC